MKVFISWSGERSKAVAAALRAWLPKVLQTVKPFMSEEDIEKGASWHDQIAKQLNDSDVGIICITPENQNSAWMIFEAGAIAKKFDTAKCCTLLFKMDAGDVKGPLSFAQATRLEKTDFSRLLKTLNSAAIEAKEPGLSDGDLEETIEAWWPKLEEKLKAIPEPKAKAPEKRPTDDKIDEILEKVRTLISTPTEASLSDDEIEKITDSVGAYVVLGMRGGVRMANAARIEALKRRAYQGPKMPECPNCKTGLAVELDKDQKVTGQMVCPTCGRQFAGS